MTETITGYEFVDRVEAVHAEIKTLRRLAHGVSTQAPNSHELHDFLAALDRHFVVCAPNLSVSKSQVQTS